MSNGKGTLDDLRIDRTAVPASPPKRGWIFGVLAIGVAIASGIWWSVRPKPLMVRTVLARASGGMGAGAATILNASGYVTARREATISSKVTGKVIEVLVEEGKRVEAGEVLARLDDSNTKTGLSLAVSQLAATKSALDETNVRLHEAELALKRATLLAKNGIATQADFDTAEAQAHAQQAHLHRLEADVAVAEQEVAVWKQQLEDTVIRAPFAGIVTSKNAQPGEMISPMSAGGSFTRTGICTIVDMESLEIEVEVNEGYINRVQPNQPVEAKLDAYPDWTIPCHVIAIIPTADRQKATVKVRVGFEKLDPRVLPQMAVKVGFRGANAGKVASRDFTLPRNAVQSIDGRDFIFVLQNGKAERRAVTVGGQHNEESMISTGLTEGEKVIVDAPKELADGNPVREQKP